MSMKVSPKMAIMSHLSDVQELLAILPQAKWAVRDINIAKAILLNYSKDLETLVDEEDINKTISQYIHR